MGTDGELTEFEFQLMVWGYAVSGIGDISVRISERYKVHLYATWDEDDKYLNTVKLNGKRPPDKFALWWVGEHERRML